MRKSAFLLGILLGMTAQALLQPLLFSQEQAKVASRELSFNRAWAEKTFADGIAPPASANRLVIVHESAPGDTKKNLSSGGSTMQLGEKAYTSGLGVTPPSVIRVELEKPAAHFKAEIGMDEPYASVNSSVRFLVEVDGKQIFASEFMKSSAGARSIDVPLNGARSFNLIVEAAPGNKRSDEADWADANVLLQDGSQLRLDELADQWDVASDLPFSFMLG